MAESSQLIVQALERALTSPDGLPLVSTKQASGLFPVGGKDAASAARSEGLLRVLRTETKGKSTVEHCTITEKGLAFLLEQSSPRPVLESLLKAIETCQTRIDEQRSTLDGVRDLATRVLNQLQKPDATLPHWARNGHSADPQSKILELLHGWQRIGDYPLPDLYEQTKAASPKLTLGQFHDALRTLHEQGKIYLHPWTGPLHELPRPAVSLLVGHEIAYYVSVK